MTGASSDEVWPLIRDFHYSKRMPAAIQYCFAWRSHGGLFGDSGEVHAAIIYGNPVSRNWPSDALELLRLVRQDNFDKPLSQFVSWSLRWLRCNTNRSFVLSYADTGQKHHGGIYQATGFNHVYSTKEMWKGSYKDQLGNVVHGRSLNSRYGSCSLKVMARKHPEWEPLFETTKHLYIKPLRQKLKSILRQQDGWEIKPYPKPINAACLSDAPSPDGVSREHTPEAAP
jgi:hypothetical protein